MKMNFKQGGLMEDMLKSDSSNVKPENSLNWDDPEHHLQKSEWRHRLITEVITDYIFVLDVEPDGGLKLTWASDNMVLQTGRKPGEILTPDSWKAIIHPDDVSMLFDFIHQMITKTEKGELECRSFHKHGGDRWIRISARQQKGIDGMATHIVGAVRDITKQKLVEQQLLYSEQKYRKLYSSLTDAFCTVNMKGEIQEFNETYRDILGYSEEELFKLTYVDLTPEKWHAMEARIVAEEIIPKGSSGIYEKEYRRKDGTIIPIEIRTFLIQDDEKNPSAMWAIVRDITERKFAEKKLKATLEEKETLLREVHHRVKNNLQTVISLIQMRSPEIHDQAALGVISELQEQIRTISVIYKELFQPERLSNVSMQPYLELLLSYLVKMFCKEGHIRLEVDCSDTVLDATWAMPSGLIVNELVTNALKYAFPKGFKEQPVIVVKLWKDDTTHYLQVIDNGIGLPDSVDRQDPSTIGLQLVNLWAKQQMNGTLDVSTTNGTVFTITFVTY